MEWYSNGGWGEPVNSLSGIWIKLLGPAEDEASGWSMSMADVGREFDDL
jgi:hypothetical protein